MDSSRPLFHAEIEATNHCNTRCLHCPHEVMSRPRGRMDWQTFETIIGKFRDHLQGERFSLSFSGMGEPLLNPLLPRFVRHVSHEARTSFACNGAVLTEQNVIALRDAGLDMIYVSFNGDEPEVFREMMGGLSYDRVLKNLRRALELTRGSRLEIRGNVSVTKATQDRVPQIHRLLKSEGVETITYSLCHSRGGNLRDASVCDTPSSPPDLVHCAVIKHTLFIDWRGRALICDHDLHGEHSLGDLMTEPLETVLARRKALVEGGMPFKMCRECNDVLKGGFHLFEHGAGGILADWIHDLYAEPTAPFAEATPAQRWMLQIYQRENRLDRAVNRLLRIEKDLQHTLVQEQKNREILRGVLDQEIENRDRRILQLEEELGAMQRTRVWRWSRWGRELLGRIESAARGAPKVGMHPSSISGPVI